MLPGLDKLEKDTILVILFTKASAGLVIVLTGLAMLANHWTAQAEPDRAEEHYHADESLEHGGEHASVEHGAEAEHGEEAAAPAEH